MRVVRVLRKCSVALTCSCGGFVRLSGRYFRCRCRPRRRRGAEESASGRGIGIGHGLPRSRAGRTASRAAAAAAARRAGDSLPVLQRSFFLAKRGMLPLKPVRLAPSCATP